MTRLGLYAELRQLLKEDEERPIIGPYGRPVTRVLIGYAGMTRTPSPRKGRKKRLRKPSRNPGATT